MAEVFIVTGAAGYLGSKTAIELLARGHTVICALRGSRQGRGEGTSPRKRLEATLAERGIDAGTSSVWFRELRLFAVHYDLEELVDSADARAHFRRDVEEILALAGAPLTEVVHVAADLSMGKGAGRREKSMKRNASGTRVTCELAIELGAKLFTDVSTWYVCGADEVLPRVRTREELSKVTWLNHYQESKAWGEREAEDVVAAHRAALEAQGRGAEAMKLRILRPSIVVGDFRHSATGWNRGELHFLFNGLLRFHIRFNLRHLAKNRRTVYMPPPLDQRQSMNLVPMEKVVGAMVQLAGKDVEGIYHLSDPDPKPLAELLEHTFRLYYPLEDLRVAFGELPPHRLKPVELLRRRVVKDIFGDLSQVVPFATEAFAAGRQTSHPQDGFGEDWRERFPTTELMKVRFLIEALEEEHRADHDTLGAARALARDVWRAPRAHRARTFRRGLDELLTQPSPGFARGWKADVLHVFESKEPKLERQRQYLYLLLANVPELIEVLGKDPEFSRLWSQAISRYDDRAFITRALSVDPSRRRAWAESTRALLDTPATHPAIEARRTVVKSLFGGSAGLQHFLRSLLEPVNLAADTGSKNIEERAAV